MKGEDFKMEKRVENREVQRYRERKKKNLPTSQLSLELAVKLRSLSVWCVFFNFVQSRNFFQGYNLHSPNFDEHIVSE